MVKILWGGLTYKDIDRLISQNGAVVARNTSWPGFDSNGWKWEEKADGTCELWYKGTVSATGASANGGYLATSTAALPFTLAYLDGAWASSEYAGVMTGADISISTTSAVAVKYFRITSYGTQSMPTAIHVVGRWR